MAWLPGFVCSLGSRTRLRSLNQPSLAFARSLTSPLRGRLSKICGVSLRPRKASARVPLASLAPPHARPICGQTSAVRSLQTPFRIFGVFGQGRNTRTPKT